MDLSIDNVYCGISTGSISKAITNKFLNMAHQRDLNAIIEYIKKETRTYADVDNAIFDFLAAKYVWHLGYAYEDAVNHPTTKIIGAIKGAFSRKENIADAYMHKCYEYVPVILAIYAAEIIKNVREFRILSERECLQLRMRYCLKTISGYSGITLPSYYPLDDCKNLLGVVTQINEFEAHLDEKFSNYRYLSSFGDKECVKVFYVRYNAIPFDLE